MDDTLEIEQDHDGFWDIVITRMVDNGGCILIFENRSDSLFIWYDKDIQRIFYSYGERHDNSQEIAYSQPNLDILMDVLFSDNVETPY